MMISYDDHVWPLWAPEWLRAQVESPNCSAGTHPRLRWLAKWLVIFFAEHEGQAARWLFHAACRCDRGVDEGELNRLLAWAGARFGNGGGATFSTKRTFSTKQSDAGQIAAAPDLEEIYRIAMGRVWSNTVHQVRNAWTELATLSACCGSGPSMPRSMTLGSVSAAMTVSGLVGSLSASTSSPPTNKLCRRRRRRSAASPRPANGASTHSPQWVNGLFWWSSSTSRLSPPWESRPSGRHCWTDARRPGSRSPVWMTVFSGNKSLQAWIPCRGEPEESLHNWFATTACGCGACRSTWCKSQFVRMPDGTRSGGVRQAIEFYNPAIL